MCAIFDFVVRVEPSEPDTGGWVGVDISEDQAHQSIRLGLGRFTTAEEVEFATRTIPEAIKDISRSSS